MFLYGSTIYLCKKRNPITWIAPEVTGNKHYKGSNIIHETNTFPMDFYTFQDVISKERLTRYIDACGGNKRKGITLYRYNLSLSSEMLKIISCFEVALRNRIDYTLAPVFGRDWLRDSCLSGGIFDNPKTNGTKIIIGKAYNGLLKDGLYTPTKLMAEMEFGVWKYMFSGPQYAATGQNLLTIFPQKPKSTPRLSIDNKHVFNELDRINQIRNRIAHHEPICFLMHQNTKSVEYATNEYNRILKLFSWMNIDSRGILFGLDHVCSICNKIMSI